MPDDYGKRITAHNKAVRQTEHELMRIAQRLCPGGHWLLQVEAREDYLGKGENGRITKPIWHVVAHNGDDNVTGQGNTLGAAAADLIHYLLNGSVYPLTGNAGRFNRDAWEKDIRKAEDDARLAAADMAYTAAQGATREAIALFLERMAESDILSVAELPNVIRTGKYSTKLIG